MEINTSTWNYEVLWEKFKWPKDGEKIDDDVLEYMILVSEDEWYDFVINCYEEEIPDYWIVSSYYGAVEEPISKRCLKCIKPTEKEWLTVEKLSWLAFAKGIKNLDYLCNDCHCWFANCVDLLDFKCTTIKLNDLCYFFFVSD